MTWPAVLLWILMLAATLSSGPSLLTLFFVAGCFGTLQMVPSTLTGGANVLPQSICAVLLIIKVALQPGNPTRAVAMAIDLRRLGLLTAFLACGLATAIVMPRLFAGRIELFSVSGLVTGTSLVQPSAGNVTQTCYMALSVATALAFGVIGGRADLRSHVATAVLLGGVATIVTGLIDLTAFTLGFNAALDPFRNATYTLLTDDEVLGSKRVVGLASEASSYGWLCVANLSLLTFLRPCFPPHLRRTVVPLTIVGLLGMAVLSTSSSAYVALAVYVAAFALNWTIRLLSPDAPAREDLRLECMAVVAAAFLLLSVVVLSPESLAPSAALLQTTLLEKGSSASFLERSTWTAFGWRAFLDTGGLGVGLGSVRVSNWFVSILGSTGVAGALLITGFIVRVAVWPATATAAIAREWQRGLRLTLLPCFAMAALISTMPDIGVFVAAIYGLLAAAQPRSLGPAARRLRPQPA